jgi:serine/threonine protein kinase
VTIFDAGEEHDLAYIAMEFLKGKDLVDFCKDGNLLPVPKVLSIVARVAEALAYAHRQNVVHRDIKPANIMYELESDTVKVTDFGIARITDSSKTKTGLVLGTPSFMSPEQMAGKKVDGRSDLYSLGVMLFQMLTGVLPFRGESMAELMYKIANEEAPDIRIIRKDLPERLAPDRGALGGSKRPETRYQDGDQFAADLRAVMTRCHRRAVPARGPAGAPVAMPPWPAAPPTPAGHEKTAAFSRAANPRREAGSRHPAAGREDRRASPSEPDGVRPVAPDAPDRLPVTQPLRPDAGQRRPAMPTCHPAMDSSPARDAAPPKEFANGPCGAAAAVISQTGGGAHRVRSSTRRRS